MMFGDRSAVIVTIVYRGNPTSGSPGSEYIVA
jgi:hypothetical protein